MVDTMSASMAYTQLQDAMRKEESFELSFINKKTGRMHTITHKVEVPESFTDQHGMLWIRADTLQKERQCKSK